MMRLNRKGKIIRNLLAIGICLFVMSWLLEFPALSRESLFRRAGHQYLLETPSVYLTSRPNNLTRVDSFILENEGRLMTVDYKKTFLGYQMGNVMLYAPEVRYLLDFNCLRKEGDGYVVQFTGQVVGFLEKAAAAELELTVCLEDGGQVQRTLELKKEDPYCFTFASLDETEIQADNLLRISPAVLRLYNENGAILDEATYERLIVGRYTAEGSIV